MSYNSAPASGTLWRQRMDRAFQAVEDVTLVTYQDFEGLVVVISANFTTCHFDPFFTSKSTGGHLMDVSPCPEDVKWLHDLPSADIHGQLYTSVVTIVNHLIRSHLLVAQFDSTTSMKTLILHWQ